MTYEQALREYDHLVRHAFTLPLAWFFARGQHHSVGNYKWQQAPGQALQCAARRQLPRVEVALANLIGAASR